MLHAAAATTSLLGRARSSSSSADFARETSDAVPILLYNIPELHYRNRNQHRVRRLFETGRFAGIKDSSGDHWPFFEQLLALKRELPFAPVRWRS